MQTPVNTFKLALKNQQPQIGFWVNMISSLSTEISAGAGFDWLLFDGEHTPNHLQSMLAHLQTIAAYDSQPVCRVPVGDTALIKQYLDLGVPNLLVPMVDTPEQAQMLVQACRYPPQGIRGMAGGRASRWGRFTRYPLEANDQICLLIQAETRLALSNLDAMLAIDGIDGVFIGPADLSASMGHVGNAGHPEVQAAIEDAILRIRKAGKAPGILTADIALSKRYLELGALFVAVGIDTQILVRGTSALLAQFKTPVVPAQPSMDKTYG